MKKIFGILLALALVLSFSLVATTPVAAATTYYVATTGDDSNDGSSGSPWKTIQHAIGQVVSGDTIMVYPGTYVENVDLDGKVLTITGIPDNGTLPTLEGTLRIANSAGPTTIEYLSFIANFDGHNDPWDSSHNNSIFIRSAEDITIRHCNFDGSGQFTDTPLSRSAINVKLASDITLDNCIIENGYWMAIYAYAGSPGVNDLTVKNSIFRNVKSGINLNEGDNLVVEDTDIHLVALAGQSDSYGVRFATNAVGYHYIVGGENMTITGGTFTVDTTAVQDEEGRQDAVIVIRSQAEGDLVVRGANLLGRVVYSDHISYSGDFKEGDEVEPPGLDARYNWWGDASGPLHETDNPGGKGYEAVDGVGSVDFMPWLMEEDGAQTTETNTGFDENASAGTTNVSADATGGNTDTTVTVGQYVGNPTAVSPGFAAGAVFFDVHVGGTEPNTLVVEFNCPGGDCSGMVLRWFDGTQWRSVTPTSVDSGKIVATLSDTSSPTIAQLTGTPFGLGGPMAPAALPAHIVGWETYPLNKPAVLAPWIALLAAIMAGAGLLVWRRRRAEM